MARPGTPLAAADIQIIRRLRSQGASVRNIAARLRVSTTTVQKYLRNFSPEFIAK